MEDALKSIVDAVEAAKTPKKKKEALAEALKAHGFYHTGTVAALNTKPARILGRFVKA